MKHSIIKKPPSKTSSGLSRWLQNLLAVLKSFRQHQNSVIGDIEGMFFHDGVLSNDQSSLHILGREGNTNDLETYQHTRHIFGARDSLTSASIEIHKTVLGNRTSFLKAAKF